MGTFHHDKGDLHGITVVVDTNDERVFVGRCDTITPQGVVLLDADLHDGSGGDAREDWLRNAVRYGVWKKYDRIVVPRDDVASVRRLAELAGQ